MLHMYNHEEVDNLLREHGFQRDLISVYDGNVDVKYPVKFLIWDPIRMPNEFMERSAQMIHNLEKIYPDKKFIFGR